MKKIISTLLLSLFLCGCNISFDTNIEKIWNEVKIGNKYAFILKHEYGKTKYYRIEQITEAEYNNEN